MDLLECTDYEVTDSLYMYELAYKEHNLSDLNVYFQKIRAYSDFASSLHLTRTKSTGRRISSSIV